MSMQAVESVDSLEAAEQWIARRDAGWADDEEFAFAVVDSDDATVLGHMSAGLVNRRFSTGWVSYWTTPEARGRGVASRACAALARWAFDEAGLHRLELGHRTNNAASCGVALAAGFAVEGLQRQKLEYDGVRHDVELHARLATDPEPQPEGR
jgi:RimJ/RimL family protein N-acetyltransferase